MRRPSLATAFGLIGALAFLGSLAKPHLWSGQAYEAEPQHTPAMQSRWGGWTCTLPAPLGGDPVEYRAGDCDGPDDGLGQFGIHLPDDIPALVMAQTGMDEDLCERLRSRALAEVEPRPASMRCEHAPPDGWVLLTHFEWPEEAIPRG